MRLQAPLSIGDSPIHRLDARVKLPVLVCFSFSTAFVESIGLLLLLLAIPSLGLIAGRIAPGAVIRRLALINLFVAAVCVWAAFALPGRAIWHMGPLVLTLEGVRYAAAIALRANALALGVIVFWATAPMHVLGRAMQRLGVPGRLTQLLLLADRYVHVVVEEWGRIALILKIRCFHLRTRLHTYRTLGYAVGMLLVRSHLRAGRIDSAMRCRGFHGEFPAEIESPRMGQVVLGAAIAAISIGILILDLTRRLGA